MSSLTLHVFVKMHVQNLDEPVAIGSMWALLDIVENENLMERLDKVEEQVSHLLLVAW